METLARGIVPQAEQKNFARFHTNPTELTVGAGKVVALSVVCLH
jgi:hypothetical protein